MKQILNVQQHDSAQQTGFKLTGVDLCRKASLLLVKTFLSLKIALFFFSYFVIAKC